MTEIVLLNTVEKVNEFVSVIKQFNSEFDVKSGKSYIDGKSIMGLLSISRDVPLQIDIQCTDNCEDIHNALKPFLCYN